MAKSVFFLQSEYEAALNSVQRSPQLRDEQQGDAISGAAHYMGGALRTHGFRLFRNGGTPLLERRDGPLNQEIIVQSPPLRRASDEAVLSLFVHISHAGLRDVRARYWTTPARAPLVLASGNAGELDIPPGWVIWNVTAGTTALEKLVDWVDELVLPWLDLFCDPEALKNTLYGRDVALLPVLNALEWVVAEFGAREARRYFQYLRDNSLVPDSWEQDWRFLALAHCFRLG